MPAVFRSDFTGQPDYLNWNAGMPVGSYMKVPDLRNPSGYRTVDAAGTEVKNLPPGAQVSNYNGMPFYPNPAGGGGGVSSMATGGSVGGSGGPFKYDAQLSQINSEFADIMKRGLGRINEEAAISGGFAGGIPLENKQRYITDIGKQQGASIERLLNDIMGRNLAWDLEQRRSSGGEGQRFGNSNQNQEMMDILGLGGPTGARFGNSPRVGGAGGYPQQGGAAGGGGGMKVGDAAWKAEQARYKALADWRAGVGPHPDTGEWKVGDPKTGQSRDTGFGGWADMGF